MNIYYFIAIKLTTYTILFIYTLGLIVVAISYNFLSIRHGIEKQNYSAYLS